MCQSINFLLNAKYYIDFWLFHNKIYIYNNVTYSIYCNVYIEYMPPIIIYITIKMYKKLTCKIKTHKIA